MLAIYLNTIFHERFKFSPLVLLIFIFQNSIILSQVNQQWVARYVSPAIGVCESNAIAVDDSGNVYVAGVSTDSGTSSDYTIVKYNSNGIQQWEAKYNGSGNSYDFLYTICIDDSSNVYVTGSTDEGPNLDVTTIKYNSNGVQEWIRRYNGTGNWDDIAEAIALDKFNNVYIAATCWEDNITIPDKDIVILKYNTSGIVQWIKKYNGTQDGWDAVHSMVLDSVGNVYVSGYTSNGFGKAEDFITMKLDSGGSINWIATYNGPGNVLDEAVSIAMDGELNVFITGFSYGISSDKDFATVKYNTNGVQQWVARFNGSGNSIDIPVSIKTDGFGNAIVCGYTTGNAEDYTTIKYDANGNQHWVRIYDGNNADNPRDLAIDNSGNIYVTGYSSYPNTADDFLTIKYKPNGVQEWLIRYNGTGNLWDLGRAMVIDKYSNVYITGLSYGAGPSEDFATVKYSQLVSVNQISNSISDKFILYPNYPNPFNPKTVISYKLAVGGAVTLKVYNALGSNVIDLIQKRQEAGDYSIEWDASDYPSGVYYCELRVKEFIQTKRMLLIK